MVHDEVRTLAAAYQRIPAHHLNAVNKLTPMNYALLAGGHGEPDATRKAQLCDRGRCSSPAPHGHHQGEVCDAKWETRLFSKGVHLQNALIQIERVNTKFRHMPLVKIQLNFTNGAHLMFVRSDPNDPASLTCQSLYHPSNVFSAATREKADASLAQLKPKLEFLVDDRGRALHAKPRLSSFHPQVLFRHAPSPFPTSQTGFAFTPMSSLSFQMRPAETVAGCRPGIRETNPAAVDYRPRVLSRSATPNLYDPIDERNRRTPDLGGTIGFQHGPLTGDVGHRSMFTPGKVRPRTVTPGVAY